MFEWRDDFSVKIPIIDEQHKRLFEIGEKVNVLMHEDHINYKEIMFTISEMYNYTKYHFDTEENLLETYAYPDLEQHKLEHKKFIEYLNSKNRLEIIANKKETVVDLLKFLASWIFNHINNSDFKYSSYIISKLEDNNKEG